VTQRGAPPSPEGKGGGIWPLQKKGKQESYGEGSSTSCTASGKKEGLATFQEAGGKGGGLGVKEEICDGFSGREEKEEEIP